MGNSAMTSDSKINLTNIMITAVIGLLSLGYAVYSNYEKTLVSQNSYFYCESQAVPEKGGAVWTIMYRADKNVRPKPWLRMVRQMGEEWNTLKRCQEIADRIEQFRQDGLIEFAYRKDEATDATGQYVLCAKTRLSGDSCPILLTLMPDDNPYQMLREVAGALMPGSSPSYQGSGEIALEKSVVINLEDQL
ncbi:COP23 domain-containing protein [Spirulina sp. CS-785/01]|uniref:COP23 domain-containing protein n=1 Tax=Spirulina sp. CS-785/01 TaxID=3021716 RepID=UPI00232D3CD7|nr:COP23 domain-containing protein [Spirulina sp. CS-785/01]MDB9312300.1 COP23 domain-containing protein [Spirulina sp. CS-785/01]